MLRQPCTNFHNIEQKESRANIERKDKIVRNTDGNALVFSCLMLSGIFWAIFHRAFTTAYKMLCNIVWNHLNNISEGIYPVQCCPRSIKTTVNWIFFLFSVV